MKKEIEEISEEKLRELAIKTLTLDAPFKGNNYNGKIWISAISESIRGNYYNSSKIHNEYDIKAGLEESLFNVLNQYKKYFKKDLKEYTQNLIEELNVDEYVDDTSEGDYYGGSTTYKLYDFNLSNILKDLISEDVEIKFNKILNKVTEEEKLNEEKRIKNEKMKKLKANLSNFEKIAENEFKNLEKELNKVKEEKIKLERKQIELQLKIENYDNIKRKNKESLEKELTNLTNEKITRKIK